MRVTRRGWGRDPSSDRSTPPPALVVALLLACASLMVLDHGDDGSVLDPARSAVGEVVGPAQSAVTTVAGPLVDLPETMRSREDLRAELTSLEAENADLRSRVRRSGFDRHRLAELDGLTRTAQDLTQALVPARVIGVGPSQSFSSTVTIDAGSDAGVVPDMTVLNNDGLVGRVLRTTASTATVLLLVDPGSTVGGRISESMELGFLSGRDGIGGDGLLDLQLVDSGVVPSKRDTVLSWGSGDGTGPYVAGVPIGEVTAVFSSVRDSSKRVEVRPFVDFTRLDVVGVVVPSGTRSDRALIEADGSLR